ncbi:MAG: 2-C-methyl-D-erythritol 4-phosphate cytidylyltransferase [Chlorobi bacterium]|nr:2-C-methyl-D-erythritol 4-phosphate cytidylyltransferase [Chlorobiota bacterium]
MTKNVAIILAGGSGTRFGYKLPKQFAKIAGKTIIEHTIETFQSAEKIEEIAIVINENFINEIENIVNKNKFNKVKRILIGGADRAESSLSAINSYLADNENVNIIFHDAVRPFVSETIINNVIDALKKYNAVDVAVPATDTIIKVSDNKIENIPDRSFLQQGQTPQAFKLFTIAKAYEEAKKDPNFKATDDCGVVLKYLPDESIFVVKGHETNIKITYELDLFIADKLFQLKQKNELDIASFNGLKNKVIVIFGGSYGIGKAIKEISLDYTNSVYSFSRTENNINISNIEDVRKALFSVFEKEGKIDYVVNTAAILNKEPLINIDNETINEILSVNFLGMINVAKESFKYLEKTKGQLLLYTSSSYTRGRANYSLYSSTKAAVVNFTQAIAEEWKEFGIKVNCINPERTKTPMRIKNFGNEPENTLLNANEVAEKSIKTLLSNFTGQVVYVKK